MSRLDELEERIMTLERIVNNLKKEVLGEIEGEELKCSMFDEPEPEPHYVNKFVTKEDGTMGFERVLVKEGL